MITEEWKKDMEKERIRRQIRDIEQDQNVDDELEALYLSLAGLEEF